MSATRLETRPIAPNEFLKRLSIRGVAGDALAAFADERAAGAVCLAAFGRRVGLNVAFGGRPELENVGVRNAAEAAENEHSRRRLVVADANRRMAVTREPRRLLVDAQRLPAFTNCNRSRGSSDGGRLLSPVS